MAKLQRKGGTASQIIEIFAQDTASTTGAGKTALTNANFSAYYKRNTGPASVAITLDASSGVTLGTYEPTVASHGAIKEVDAVNMPGLYEYHLANNGLAAGADEVVFMLTGSGFVVAPIEIELTTTSNQSADGGLTLAKTTNLTGLNDIAATAIVSNGPITTSGGKVSEVALVDMLTTYTGNTPQTGDSYARIGATGSGLTSLAPAATALSTAQWTNGRAANLDNLDAAVSSRLAAASYIAPDNADIAAIAAKLPTNHIADETLLLAAIGSPMQAGPVTLAASQPNYAPATVAALAAVATNVASCLALALADERTDTGTNPWNRVLLQQGTGGIGVGTELLRQKLYDSTGAAITDTNTVIAAAHV